MFSPGPRFGDGDGLSIENFLAQPPQGFFWKWIAGLALPLMIGCVGLREIITQQATLYDRSLVTVTGRYAVVAGVIWLAVMLYLHCHFFWGNIYDNAFLAQLGKITAILAGIIALGSALI